MYQTNYRIKNNDHVNFVQKQQNQQQYWICFNIINQNLDFLPRLFTITTNNGSYKFNVEILKDLSKTISDQLEQDPTNLEYHLKFSDDQNIIKKIENILLGQAVSFENTEFKSIHEVIQELKIDNCPNFFKQNLEDEKELSIPSRIEIEIDRFSLLRFLKSLESQKSKKFKIKTNKNEYNCTELGVLSSKIICDLKSANPELMEYTYNYEDNDNEFKFISMIFDFEDVDITIENLDSLKLISDQLKIDLISGSIKEYVKPSVDDILQMAINFSSIQSLYTKNIIMATHYPPSVLFTVLNHPKCRFPSKREFNDQVINFLKDENIKTNDFLPLFSYIDFSVASLEQLRELSMFDKDEIYGDLSQFLKIRKSEFDIQERNQFIQNCKQGTSLNLLKFQQEKDYYQKESKNKRDEIANLQKLKSEEQKKFEEEENKYHAGKKETEKIKIDFKLDKEDDSKSLDEKIKNIQKEKEKLDKSIDKFQTKLDKQKEDIKLIENIKQLRIDYNEAKLKQDELKNRYDATKTTKESFKQWWNQYKNSNS